MRYAVCNELFGERPLKDVARIIQEEGFQGIEFAPFTIFGDFSKTALANGIASVRAVLADYGLLFAGFHWLLVKPKGLHITTPDVTVRRRSWDHIRRLMDSAAELGGGPLILGSPLQRSTTAGATKEQATAILMDELAAIAPHAVACRTPILLEPLPSVQSDIVNSLDEARRIIESIDSSGVSGIFDFHNTENEKASWEELIRANKKIIKHVHANEMDGGFPGGGQSDYAPAFNALREIGFTGWVSIEIFTIPHDPAIGLRHALKYFETIQGH